MFFVENDAGRYTFGTTTDGLKKEPDGSLTILIQKDRPADMSNWLPAPAGPFNLTMRLYGPETPVLDGSYRLPPVTRVPQSRKKLDCQRKAELQQKPGRRLAFRNPAYSSAVAGRGSVPSPRMSRYRR